MKRLFLIIAAAAMLSSCATSPPTGLSLAATGHLGPIPYRVSYAGGKAIVAVSAPWRNLLPDNSK